MRDTELMPPVTDLHELLSTLSPFLEEGEYVFCTAPDPVALPLSLEPLATVREPEGLSLILSSEAALRAGLSFEGPFRLISLRVQSSLEAVGLTAAVSQALAAEGISANMIAGYHHDYILVPDDRADDAISTLLALARISALPEEE